ncbi:hypothetical protein LEP1GSC193_3216 [Leptospira alstonii serovar Pingchang str. 80-412]|uniref:Uncharacterized protein n=2 Tax=Leptospira alstonii TaxID=28452 RepID=M6D8P4_9LEPT|nr:hypothetical protein LEP1GSC194_2996 [Leptospira alstonii serovar Sichuan str. 79601]EQA79370.1 hypothetical protein LEP1GSC193_3216 [Leptospira alstonii serovar Pingchang str. 80-412]
MIFDGNLSKERFIFHFGETRMNQSLILKKNISIQAPITKV